MYKAEHYPVFGKSIITLLDIQPSLTILDGTCGEGGHAECILEYIDDKGFYIGLDKDPSIIQHAFKRLSRFQKKFTIIHSSYADSKNVLENLSIPKVDRIILDLGLSMYHIRHLERGFSYQSEAILDMRFDQTGQSKSAFELIHTLSEEELTRILVEYGEEKYAKKIAKKIVEVRKTSLIKTCQDLTNIILSVKPFKGHIHPATKSFQAFRIAVNGELSDLTKLLNDIPCILREGGKIGIISYHSLEDRIVKHFLQHHNQLKPETKKMILPLAEEINLNPASRSAKLRIGVFA